MDFILGLAGNANLRRRTATLEQSTIARVDQNSGLKVRRFKKFYAAAASWRRVERIIARVEAGPQRCDTRYIVTNLTKGTGKALYDKLYCARGPSAASWPRSLREADRASADARWPRTISRRGRPTSPRSDVGLYVDPPEHAIVLSIDEKSQIQALDRTQPGLPMKRRIVQPEVWKFG